MTRALVLALCGLAACDPRIYAKPGSADEPKHDKPDKPDKDKADSADEVLLN